MSNLVDLSIGLRLPAVNESLTISVIICTRNRASSLKRTLDALRKAVICNGSLTDVIVVDNGSTDETAEVISAYAGDKSFPLKRIWEPSAGLSRARNAGILASRGAIIAFTDDDCLVSPNWLRAITSAFSADLRQVIAGRVDLHDPKHLPVSVRLGMDPELLTRVDQIGAFLLGANMAFGRKAWDEVGPFDPLLGAGTPFRAAEDTDFAYRALRRGIDVRYDPKICVRHDHGRKESRDVSRLVYGYAIGSGAMMMKYVLRGDCRLVRPLYWELRSTIINTWRRPSMWRELLARRGYLTGALKYCFLLRRTVSIS